MRRSGNRPWVTICAVGVLHWNSLSLAEAKALADQWVSGRAERLSWLADQLGVAAVDSPDYLDTGWEWFLKWRTNPLSARDQPTPLWWREWEHSQHFGRDEAVALDAFGHALEVFVLADCPQLQRWFAPPSFVNGHRPLLGVRYLRPQYGCTHSTVLDVMHEMWNWGDDWADPHRKWRPQSPDRSYLKTLDYYETSISAEPPPTIAEQVDAAPPFDLERVTDDPDYPHHIVFDDFVAYDCEDLVARFVDALQARGDLKDVAHLDREVIGVRKGRVRLADLRQWGWDWWRAEVPRDAAD